MIISNKRPANSNLFLSSIKKGIKWKCFSSPLESWKPILTRFVLDSSSSHHSIRLEWIFKKIIQQCVKFYLRTKSRNLSFNKLDLVRWKWMQKTKKRRKKSWEGRWRRKSRKSKCTFSFYIFTFFNVFCLMLLSRWICEWPFRNESILCVNIFYTLYKSNLRIFH